MSHHLDSPLARQDPRLNITDQYVFDDQDSTVFVLNVRTSLGGDTVPTGFHDEGRYELKIHLDGSSRENLTFRLAFEPEADGVQSYQVFRLEGDTAADDASTGAEVAHGRTGTPAQGVDGLLVWAGRVLDPFFIDLDLLGAIDQVVQHGQDADITRFTPGTAANSFAGATVNSIVLRIPHRDRQLFAGRDIRAWGAAKLATDAGGWRQIGRTGLPMIWPIFRDADSTIASESNEVGPEEDGTTYGEGIRDLIAGTVQRLGTAERPEAYAALVIDRIRPDTLPYRIGSPATFGFATFNGRRLGDNAPEVMFSLVTNSAVGTGLPPAASQETRSAAFPYVVPV